MYVKTIIAILVLSLTTACASHQAAFISNPPGAQVVIDGQVIGTTPCKFDYHVSRGETHQLTMAKPGFEPVTMEIKAEEVDKATRNRWLVAGAVWSPLWVGTLYSKKLKDNYEFTLLKSRPNMTASASLPESGS